MLRVHEGAGEVAVVDGAARVGRIYRLHTARVQMHGNLKDRYQRRARLLADRNRIADMIVMAVGQHHMGHPFGDLIDRQPGCLERPVARQKRIDQDDAVACFNAECGMSIPGDFHVIPPLGGTR